ncbi:hypothetical protein ILS93_00850 [Bacillus sp. 16GRE42]|uniref:hypothetical protein n=1 Tax=Bacillus sp. 16GRE42 TaxID=2778092 RepID=UPI001C9B28E9|nr:hypothetical protein [Bacillus sp. 16GRE42]MBY7120676.1 hypothetical protein [Bacillus sp. 16GRE42]
MEIVLNSELFTEEQKEYLKPQILQLISNLSVDLDVSTLKKVIIPKEFTKEIILFQKEHNKQEKGHTKNEHEEAKAKVMYYMEDGNYYQTVFLHEMFITGVMFGDDKVVNNCYSFIRHELGHVHDEFNKRKIYSDDLRKGIGLTQSDFILTIPSDIVWSEYFANRTAGKYLTTDLFLEQASYTFDLIDRAKEQCTKYVKEYRKHADVNLLLEQIMNSTHMLFYFSALSLGNLHYYKETLDEPNYKIIKESMEKNIAGTYYEESWNLIDKALINLYSKYPQWNDIYQLEELNQAIHKCWNHLGIYLEDYGENMFINVPL